MKSQNEEVQFTIEDVNLNYLGEWNFMKMPKSSDLVKVSIYSTTKYYIVYNEFIEVEDILFVEELTEKEFYDYKKEFRYTVHSADIMN